MCHELEKLGLTFERQRPLPLVYGTVRLACAYRMDLVVGNSIVVEVKAVAKTDRVHEAQLISYLKISGLPLGLLLNFNVRNPSREGLVRKANNFPEQESGLCALSGLRGSFCTLIHSRSSFI